MIKNLLDNWKTTSAGVALIGHGVIHVIFCFIHKTLDEVTVNLSLGEVLAGIGLIVAGDAASSAKAHQETLAELDNIKSAVRTGDTSILTKADVANPQKQP